MKGVQGSDRRAVRSGHRAGARRNAFEPFEGARNGAASIAPLSEALLGISPQLSQESAAPYTNGLRP
eukprot:9197995-Alexandrium_andersonii.AAC.1